MPPATTPIIIMLLVGNLAQMVSHSVLVHTGFFKEVARISFALVAVLTGIAAFAVWAHFDIVQFLQCLRRGLHLRRAGDGGIDDPRADPAGPRGARHARGGVAIGAASRSAETEVERYVMHANIGSLPDDAAPIATAARAADFAPLLAAALSPPPAARSRWG